MTNAHWQQKLEGVLETATEHSGHGETHGALAPETLDALQAAGLLRLWRPRSLGGFEVSPCEYAELAEAVAARDTAAAWLMMGAANTTFDLRLASEAFVEEVYGDDRDAVVCETFNRPLHATVVDGGYRVSGGTAFASGCKHADWIGHTALEGERLLLMFHPAGALTIEEDWDTLGLRGTASNTISAEGVFVPAHRVIDFSASPTINAYFQGTLYRLPEAILTATFPPVALGALSAALAATDDIAANKVPFAATSTLKHRHLAQMRYGRALATGRAARALLRQELSSAWAFSRQHKADLFLACTFALQGCADAVLELTQGVGTSSVYRRSPIERAFRDVQVIRHHAFGAEGRFATVAQVYWGLDVDFPLLEMD
jgi:alkylation response protein AidB-like acyl-CoA dehydrogenase